MTEKNSADANVDSENVTTDELQDPMSGYTSADALGSARLTGGAHGADRLRDPMSGYAGADAMKPEPAQDEVDIDSVHADKTQDSMSGYASADALNSDE